MSYLFESYLSYLEHYTFLYIFKIIEDSIVCKTNHTIPEFLQASGSNFVIFLLSSLCMIASIDFYDQTRFSTDKIHNIYIYDILS